MKPEFGIEKMVPLTGRRSEIPGSEYQADYSVEAAEFMPLFLEAFDLKLAVYPDTPAMRQFAAGVSALLPGFDGSDAAR